MTKISDFGQICTEISGMRMLQSAAKGGGLSSQLIEVTHLSCDAVVVGVV